MNNAGRADEEEGVDVCGCSMNKHSDAEPGLHPMYTISPVSGQTLACAVI